MILAATQLDVATYVNALFTVYIVLIFCNILLSFIPRMPTYSPALRAVLDFVTETTDPYLNVFRRIMRPIGGPGGLSFDLSPMLALLVLFILQGVVIGAVLE
jgi:YggT family protein